MREIVLRLRACGLSMRAAINIYRDQKHNPRALKRFVEYLEAMNG